MSSHLREENRILRFLLAEAVHELGRAVEVSEDALQSRRAPKKTAMVQNPITRSYIVAPSRD